MSQQNFIDSMYGTLSAINSTEFPVYGLFSSSGIEDVLTMHIYSNTQVINEWWAPLLQWTNTGTVIPFNNWNDWFHYVTW